MKVFIPLILSLIFTSCSQGKKTNTSFKVSTDSIYRSLEYGEGNISTVILLGESTKGDFFQEIIKANNDGTVPPKELEIPYGKWDFYAIVWQDNRDGGGTGEDWIDCAYSKANNIEGDSLNVELFPDQHNCIELGYSLTSIGGESKVAPTEVYFDSCSESSFSSANWSSNPGESDCPSPMTNIGTSEITYNGGFASHFKLVIKSGNNFSGALAFSNNSKIDAGCFERNDSNIASLMDGDEFLPLLNFDGIKFYYSIYQYFDKDAGVFDPDGRLDCKGSRYQEIALSNAATSLNAKDLNNVKIRKVDVSAGNDGSEFVYKIRVKSSFNQACSFGQMFNESFQAIPVVGHGTENSPYVMCDFGAAWASMETGAKVIYPKNPNFECDAQDTAARPAGILKASVIENTPTACVGE